MKKRISSAFDEMCLNFGYFAFVWFIMWAIWPSAFQNWTRHELLIFGGMLLVMGFFKGYRDQVKKDKAAKEAK